MTAGRAEGGLSMFAEPGSTLYFAWIEVVPLPESEVYGEAAGGMVGSIVPAATPSEAEQRLLLWLADMHYKPLAPLTIGLWSDVEEDITDEILKEQVDNARASGMVVFGTFFLYKSLHGTKRPRRKPRKRGREQSGH